MLTDQPHPDAPQPVMPATLVAEGTASEPTVVDFGALDGDASYMFYFTAIQDGASTAIAGDDAFAIKLDQWNQQGLFGTTEFGVADNLFTAIDGQSVASIFGGPVHVVIVSNSVAAESHLYINGVLSGTWAPAWTRTSGERRSHGMISWAGASSRMTRLSSSMRSG